MKNILAICGSLRKNSSNEKLILAAKKLQVSGIHIEFFESIDQLPYFNPDLESGTLPESVRTFQKQVIQSDALLISSPEYIHAIPGVLKNALEWLVACPEFEGKPVIIISGGEFAPAQLEEVLRTMSAKVIQTIRIYGPKLRKTFDENGELVDRELKSLLYEALLNVI